MKKRVITIILTSVLVIGNISSVFAESEDTSRNDDFAIESEISTETFSNELQESLFEEETTEGISEVAENNSVGAEDDFDLVKPIESDFEIEQNNYEEESIEVIDDELSMLEEAFVVQASEASGSSITLNKLAATIPTQKTLQLKATASSSGDSVYGITWSSTDPSVAAVDKYGKVTAKAYGRAVITATAPNGDIATCVVQTRFHDVINSGKAYYIPVYWAVNNGITKSTVAFNPENTVTRGEFVAFIWRMEGSPKASAKTSFKDVNTKTKYYDAIRWAVGKKIIQGYSDKTFRPTANVTRGEAATMLWRWAGRQEPKTKSSPFSDIKASKADSYKAILWGSENGIIKGSNGKFLKNNGCTRGNVVTFLYRYEAYENGDPYENNFVAVQNYIKKAGTYKDGKYVIDFETSTGKVSMKLDENGTIDYSAAVGYVSSGIVIVHDIHMFLQKGNFKNTDVALDFMLTQGSTKEMALCTSSINANTFERDQYIAFEVSYADPSSFKSTAQEYVKTAYKLVETVMDIWNSFQKMYTGYSLEDIGMVNYVPKQ